MESNDAASQRFCRDVSSASIRVDHPYCLQRNRGQVGEQTLSGAPQGPGAAQSQYLRRTNELNSEGVGFEMIFAISPRKRARLQKGWRKKFPKLQLTRIGCLNPQSAIRNPQLKGGYVHFQ